MPTFLSAFLPRPWLSLPLRGDPLGRLVSEVLGLNNARARPALRQKLPGDASHQRRGGQNGDIGLLANGSLAL